VLVKNNNNGNQTVNTLIDSLSQVDEESAAIDSILTSLESDR